MMFTKAQGVPIGLVEISFQIRGKSEQHFDLGVTREAAAVLQIRHAKVFVQTPTSGSRGFVANQRSTHSTGWAPQLRKKISCIAHQQRVRVHQHRALLLGFDRERGEN